MSSTKADRPVCAETESPQINTPKAQRPRVRLECKLFNNALRGLGRKEIVQDKKEEFIKSKRSADSSLVSGDPPIVTSTVENNTNDQPFSNLTAKTLPLRDDNQRANVKNNDIENTEPKPIAKVVTGRTNSNDKEFIKDRVSYVDKFGKDKSQVNERPHIDLEYTSSPDNFSKNSKLKDTECASSFPSSSAPSVQSYTTKRASDKERFNKSTRNEDSGSGWPDVDFEENRTVSVDEDGWGTLSDTDNDDSWDTSVTSPGSLKYTDKKSVPTYPNLASVGSRTEKEFNSKDEYRHSISTSAQSTSSRGPIKQDFKYKHNNQHIISASSSAQSVSVRGRAIQDLNNKHKYQQSISTSSPAQSASFGRRETQDFKNNSQHGISSSAFRPALNGGQNFNNNYNSDKARRQGNQKDECGWSKQELKNDGNKPDSEKTKTQEDKEEESGWPTLELEKDRRHSYDDGGGWDDDCSIEQKGNFNDKSAKYQRSISTPFTQSSSTREDKNQSHKKESSWGGFRHESENDSGFKGNHANKSICEVSSRSKFLNEDGQIMNCSDNLPDSRINKNVPYQQVPYKPHSNPQFARSSSFRDKTERDKTNDRNDSHYLDKKNFKRRGYANNQGFVQKKVDTCDPGYSDTYPRKPQTNFNYKSGSQDDNTVTDSYSTRTNTETADWQSAWRENKISKTEANCDTDCNFPTKEHAASDHTTVCSDKPNSRSEINLIKTDSSTDNDIQEDTSGDGWSTFSEDSVASAVELKENCGKFESNRVVTSSNENEGILSLKIQCNFKDHHPKTDSTAFESGRDHKSSASYSCKSADEILHLVNDPLEMFFENCSSAAIPAPRPAVAVPKPLAAGVVTNAASTEGNHSLKASDYNSVTDLELDFPTTCEALDHVPDTKQVQEITTFLKDIEDKKSMPLKIANEILSDVTSVLNYYVKGHYVYLYGSYLSGLAVSTSNLNLALKSDMPPKNSSFLHLQKLFSNTNKGLENYQVEPFDEDKDPRKSKICFTEPKAGISCELAHFGSRVSKYRKMDSLIEKVCRFDARIKTLLIATRIWAEVCLINEPEEGKLHTLGYTLLMLHFLQNMKIPLLPIVDISSDNWGLNPLERKNDSIIGELWLEFLKYYSGTFDWESTVVTIHCKTVILKSSKSWENSWIAIEDPFTQKNIAETVINHECAECIFSCFKASYQYFSSPVDFEDSDSSDSGITGCPNTILRKEKNVYSFNNITYDQQLPTFCEKCDELDEPCGKCRPSQEVILHPLPKLSDLSLKCVNTALHDVYDQYILPQNGIAGRKAFVLDLERSVKQVYPSARLTLFGSSVNAFGFKRSDLDICMTLNKKPQTNSAKSMILKSIVRHLRKKPQLYENVIGLYHAKIPIVKFRFIRENWNCDLSLYNVLAIHNSSLLCKYALMDKRCRILGCAMKLLAKKACLDDSALHSLSSYSYILMVIHYLQQVEPPVLPVLPVDDKKVFEENLEIPNGILKGRNYWYFEDSDKLKNRYLPHSNNESSVGELWLGFLDFYARYDGTNTVTITQKEPLPSTLLLRCARLFNIEDPFLTRRNLGCIVNDTRAEVTRKVLGRARLLFGKEVQKDCCNNPKRYFFSSSNLTGQFIKEVECIGCGGFGHEQSDCPKANPFKRSKFRNRFPNPRYPYKQKVWKKAE